MADPLKKGAACLEVQVGEGSGQHHHTGSCQSNVNGLPVKDEDLKVHETEYRAVV